MVKCGEEKGLTVELEQSTLLVYIVDTSLPGKHLFAH